ncbi:tetratricopeptide domain protein [Metarhizium robertsii]|uniref:Tetratricopeptide domain protein n=1 Tax=Metarhizium robertsii TaxID=568076 RepID=A0A0A1V3P8_9HYPO|nr:tetratricopeptide domain protein [Metarhizium robertsii]
MMSSSRDVEGETALADMVVSGRQFYEAQQYKRALEQFTRAMKYCPCARGVKRERCTCKNFERVAAEEGCIFKEAMYNCKCDVGRTFNKCDNRNHIQALDYRAATFEALGKLDRAKKDAEWILELAPRLPDGYLRLGKVARLQKNHEFAWKIYNAGISINKDVEVASSPKLQQLYKARTPLHRHFSRKDPLRLPTEIAMLIFSYMEFTELPYAPCLNLPDDPRTDLWRRTLTSPLYDRLWRTMIFPGRGMKRAPRYDALKKMLSWAGKGGARKIVIPLPKAFLLNQQKLTLLLKASPCLEYLEIGPQFDILMFPPKENMWTKLRHVSINGTGDPAKPAWSTPVIPIGGFPLAFLNNAAASLEHLVLTGIPEPWYMTQSVPFLPNLKTLRMCNISTLRQSFPIFFLSDAFPRLEQLWIGPNIPNLDSNSLSGWREKWHTMWNHLKVLIFEESSVVGPISQVENSLLTLRLLTCLNYGNSLQHIRFDIPSDNEDRHGRHRVFSNSRTLHGDIDIPQYPEFRNLHSLASKSLCISPDILRLVFSDALNMGKIQSFDIVFPIESLNDRVGDRSITHLKGYEWLRGAASITSMGCYRFRFRSYPRNDDDLPLPQFLASFPNLETLSIFSENYEEAEFAGVVAAILKVTTLKTIYTTSVKGAVMDQLRTVAESQGVKLIWGHQPQAWPVPLDES